MRDHFTIFIILFLQVFCCSEILFKIKSLLKMNRRQFYRDKIKTNGLASTAWVAGIKSARLVLGSLYSTIGNY